MVVQDRIQSDLSRLTRGALLALLSGASLSVMSAIIVNVALPSIQEEFSASSSAISSVVAYYGLAYGVLLIIGGRLGDRYGRRRAFTAGLAIFSGADRWSWANVCTLARVRSFSVASRPRGSTVSNRFQLAS